jgi:hypothetical protein
MCEEGLRALAVVVTSMTHSTWGGGEGGEGGGEVHMWVCKLCNGLNWHGQKGATGLRALRVHQDLCWV